MITSLISPGIILAKIFENFIDDDGHVYRDGYPTGERFPLRTRHWYITDKGRAEYIFIDIQDVSVLNGFCHGGTEFKHHESGGLIMKCLDIYGSGKLKQFLLFKTKDHHYLELGSCIADDYVLFSSEPVIRFPDWSICKPSMWYTQSDVGHEISPEECHAIIAKVWRYNFDFLCR